MTENLQAFGEIGIALAQHFDSLYYVDIDTGNYTEYVRKGVFDVFGIPTEGDDFFTESQTNAVKCIYPDDLEFVVRLFDRETVLKRLSGEKSYSTVYRLIVDGRVEHVQLIVLMCEDKKHVIFCLENIEDEIRKKTEQDLNLQSARRLARLDDLTGIRNKNAFIEMSESINAKMKSGGEVEPFGIMMCDVNDLKRINDTRGHSFGDEALQRASRMICGIFKRSPVFRVGGDEFVVILQGEDLEKREQLQSVLRKESAINKRSRTGPEIACGMAVYDPGSDTSFETVYERADRLMYDNKSELKSVHIKDGFTNMEKTDIPIPDERKRLLDGMFGALLTVAGGGYVYLNDMKYDFSRWSLPLIDDFDLASEYMYHADSIWQDYVHPDDLGVYREAVDAVLYGNAEVRAACYRARRADGTYVRLTTRGFVLCDSDGTPEYFGGIIVEM
ncbi:MAG: diguanylate cyclase [Lachnospiraceae bacterium]|nr:diguanylate cyclase [Lachnospiraceae bacterium]